MLAGYLREGKRNWTKKENKVKKQQVLRINMKWSSGSL